MNKPIRIKFSWIMMEIFIFTNNREFNWELLYKTFIFFTSNYSVTVPWYKHDKITNLFTYCDIKIVMIMRY